jgi:hypothetical protein
LVLTFERAHQLLKLDVEIGILTWRMPVGGRTTTGSRAGSISGANRYRWLKIDGKPYCEHLVIWLMLTGEWCPRQIDHIDRDRTNNKPSNLRKATETQQRANAKIRVDNRLGVRGVCKHSLCDKYKAVVRHKGRDYYLGLFDTISEAAAVTRAKRLELFGEHAPDYDKSDGG